MARHVNTSVGTVARAICYLLLGATLGAALPPAIVSSLAYVEPVLAQANTDQLSVIVTGANLEQVATTIQQLGGYITADLWLIDAVAAEIPTGQISTLARQPGIRSITANKSVDTADNAFDGWITDRRIYRGAVALAGEPVTSPVALPDGGILTLTKPGMLQIFNADGSERSRTTLPDGPFQSMPVVDADGNVYVAGKARHLHSLTPKGAIRWTVTHIKRSVVSLALDSSRSTLYVVDNSSELHALDTATGARRWQGNTGRNNMGNIELPPALAPDGTIHLLTKKGFLMALKPDGSWKWATWLSRQGSPYRLWLQVGQDGVVYVASESGWIQAFKADGNLKYERRADVRLSVQPVLANDGALYIAAKSGEVYALNADGSLRFHRSARAGRIVSPPLLSPDEQNVYVAVKEQKLFALDVTSGELLWQHETSGDLRVPPMVEDNGNIHVIDANGNYAILNAAGVPIGNHRLTAPSRQAAIMGLDPRKNVYLDTGKDTLQVFSRLPDLWDGSPDVAPTDQSTVWKLVNPVAIDVGADILHEPQDPTHPPITGQNITVAVLDSGVQFDSPSGESGESQVAARFLGQADFVDKTCQASPVNSSAPTVGVQHDGYCFLDSSQSRDGYGHGTHVTGIIWNNFTEYDTGVFMGIAPQANILSVRVLDDAGVGTYADAIQGIQYVVAHKDMFKVRVLNLSISAYATTPYFVDPLNRAVEQAWSNGIVVVAAAGNEGPESESITVPGNDPYVITVGAIDSIRTPGYWNADTLPSWSATGPTLDGFVKPDVLAPGTHIVSLMSRSAKLMQEHPDNLEATNLFRMSGTSMATAVTSGIVALMLQAHPTLDPDQVKFRLGYAARPAATEEGFPIYSMLQQGMGRVWAPTAVFGSFPDNGRANQGMDIKADLAHGWETESDVAYHYQGPIQRILSDDGSTYLYYVQDDNKLWGLGAVGARDKHWIGWETLAQGMATWSGGTLSPASGIGWAGGLTQPAGMATWSGGMATWSGGMATWSGGMATWSGGMATWSGGMATWSGGMATWSGGIDVDASTLSSTSWVNDDGSTNELQSHIVFHPAPDWAEVRPTPDGGPGVDPIFLPLIQHEQP